MAAYLYEFFAQYGTGGGTGSGTGTGSGAGYGSHHYSIGYWVIVAVVAVVVLSLLTWGISRWRRSASRKSEQTYHDRAA